MTVVPVGKTNVSHCRLGSPGIGQATVGMPVRLIETAEQVSSAVATPSSSSSKSEHELVVALTAGGAVSVGGVVSPEPVTMIRCVQEATRPTESVAVQVMTVVPTGYGSLVRC